MNTLKNEINSTDTGNRQIIGMIKSFTEMPENGFAFFPYDNGAEAVRFNFRSIHHREKKAFIVTAEETALELGSPQHDSLVTVVWTDDRGALADGVWVSGADIQKISGTKANLLIAVMAEVPSGYDPDNTRFRSIVNLSNRVPGYMSRSVPGKLWVRISGDLMNKQFSSMSLGMCILHAFHEAVPGLGAVSVIIAAGDGRLTKDFETVYNLERVYSGKNRKLSLDRSGVLECEDLNCSSCEEKKSCDTIREILTIKRMKERRGES